MDNATMYVLLNRITPTTLAQMYADLTDDLPTEDSEAWANAIMQQMLALVGSEEMHYLIEKAQYN